MITKLPIIIIAGGIVTDLVLYQYRIAHSTFETMSFNREHIPLNQITTSE